MCTTGFAASEFGVAPSNPTNPANPCSGANPNNLNYTAANGQQHIMQNHMAGGKRGTAWECVGDR